MSKIQIDSCAAGPWNYDMSQTPKDGRDVFFLKAGVLFICADLFLF